MSAFPGLEGIKTTEWLFSEQKEADRLRRRIKKIKNLVEEFIWLHEYSDPQTTADLDREETRIQELQDYLVSLLDITFDKYSPVSTKKVEGC
jgi:hypothetical protein